MLIDKFQFIEQNKTSAGRFSVGANYLFTAELFLSVGETCGLPRANAVRPYRVLGKYFAISPLILHAIAELFLFILIYSQSVTQAEDVEGYHSRQGNIVENERNLAENYRKGDEPRAFKLASCGSKEEYRNECHQSKADIEHYLFDHPS